MIGLQRRDHVLRLRLDETLEAFVDRRSYSASSLARPIEKEERVRGIGDSGLVAAHAERFGKGTIAVRLRDHAERNHSPQHEVLARTQHGPVLALRQPRWIVGDCC